MSTLTKIKSIHEHVHSEATSNSKSTPICQTASGANIHNAFQKMLRKSLDAVQNLYLITIDDTPTFVVPNTVFGVAGWLTGSVLISVKSNSNIAPTPLTFGTLIYAIFQTIVFNWLNLLIFDFANQRQASSEDVLNKPWRPIPSGRMTTTQMRYCLMAAIPLVLGYNHFVLGAGTETCLLVILTWLYNDLGGGDDNWIVRNWIIACAFGVYNMGSMKVAAGMASPAGPNSELVVSNLGYAWTVLISGVIFTTMHVQDLKDVAGDKARGRRSAPIVYGHRAAAWTILVPVVVWTGVCIHFWSPPLLVALMPILLGLTVVWRLLTKDGKPANRKTWQLWCAWTAILYIIPPLSV